MTLQTEFDFVLPRGYLDSTGQVQRTGRMRLATALDEIDSLHDPRVQTNEAYLPVVLLSRVITHLGSLTSITPQVMEGLFASDLAYLEDVYMRFNSADAVIIEAVCPACSTRFQLQVSPLGVGEDQ
jgi:hypothetical protein